MGIIGNISFAKLDLSEDLPSYGPICQAEKSAFRARLLSQQFLTFYKGVSPVRKTTSVRQLLEETAVFVLSGSDIICKFDIEDDLLPADIDVGQISRVIENLVINASQAMPAGGMIVLGAKNILLENPIKKSLMKLSPGRYIEISVKDSGIGISAKNLERIFDPYFTTKQTGSGLGLATSYSIIHKHGGDIIVKSEIDKGSEFIVYIPASNKKLSQKKSSGKEIIMGKGHILVMDDEPVIRDIMNTSLKRLGYTSVCVPDGQKAINAYQSAMRDNQPFDAVILDMTIPGGMGGVETADLLKALDPNVKSIVSSGYATKDVMSVPERLGFCGVLTKPYSIQQLSDVLHTVLDQ
jgi:CheY-like chemotaxis protein